MSYKIAIIGLIAIITLSSCSSSSNQPESSVNNFGIYEDGKFIMDINQLEPSETTGTKKHISYNLNEVQENLFPDREIETKGGIKEGSTIKELVDAYDNTVFWVQYNTFEYELDTPTDYLQAKEFYKQYLDNKELFISPISIHLCLLDGDVIELQTFNLDGRNFGSILNDSEFLESHNLERYVLSFMFDDSGIIYGIIGSYTLY